jgi:hypothetical protein
LAIAGGRLETVFSPPGSPLSLARLVDTPPHDHYKLTARKPRREAVLLSNFALVAQRTFLWINLFFTS